MTIIKEEKKNGMNIVDNMDGEKRANDKLQDKMRMARLTEMQQATLRKKQRIADATGEQIKPEELAKDKLFIVIGDDKDPATAEEIKVYLKSIKKGN